ncbi:hypothetical protein TNCT_558621 [Trichonephila clavata]|uniref:Uncharacterized protein n=1 Tax=Trichonephila clavata TaxID=2740835 RepID=A0A8X6HT57_TRICU|nr:hypothetical protein TNCT_558621 [Trichonephila clavata]
MYGLLWDKKPPLQSTTESIATACQDSNSMGWIVVGLDKVLAPSVAANSPQRSTSICQRNLSHLAVLLFRSKFRLAWVCTIEISQRDLPLQKNKKE